MALTTSSTINIDKTIPIGSVNSAFASNITKLGIIAKQPDGSLKTYMMGSSDASNVNISITDSIAPTRDVSGLLLTPGTEGSLLFSNIPLATIGTYIITIIYTDYNDIDSNTTTDTNSGYQVLGKSIIKKILNTTTIYS